MKHPTNAAESLVKQLSEARDLTLFGNKAAALALLIDHGIAVPAGFAVSFDAYRQAVSEFEVQDSSSSNEQSKFSTKFFDKQLLENIAVHYKCLQGNSKNNPVIVRSSSNAEDSADASFAGQFETILDVMDMTGCFQAIWQCWMSARYSNVLAYCEKQGIDPDDLRMGVIVQLQRQPDAAGVLFTQDPFSFTDGVSYAEGVEGNAAGLVDGSVEPDFRFWSNDRGILARQDFFKESIQLPLGARKELVDVANGIQELFGKTQDIEWVYSQDHGVEIVQARPITGSRQTRIKRHPDAWQLPGMPVGGWSDKQRQVFDQWDIYNSNFITPLDWSLFERLAWEANLRMFDFLDDVPHVEDVAVIADGVVIGIDPTACQSNENHRVRVPSYQIIDDWEPVFALWESKLKDLNSAFENERRNLGALVRLLVRTGDLYAECHCVRMASTARWIDPMGELDPAEDAENKIRVLLEREYGDETNTVLVDVGSGVDHETARMNEGLWKLCQEAVETQELKLTPDIKHKIGLFVGKFGHFQHDNVALGNSPQFVFEQIEQALAEGSAGSNLVEDGRQRFKLRFGEMKRRYTAHGFSSISQEIDRLRLWIERRESSKSKQNIALPLMRTIASCLGNILCSVGEIAKARDVQFLTTDELALIATGSWKPSSELIFLRRNYCDWKSHRSWLPEGFFGLTGTRSQDSFFGEGVSEGVARENVCVVSGPEEFSKIKKNDIVVASTTSPIWSQVMSKASGIIVEYGARLSHTSIAAREYNIPAIINIKNARKIFLDGDVIEMDGTSGAARFISRNDE